MYDFLSFLERDFLWEINELQSETAWWTTHQSRRTAALRIVHFLDPDRPLGFTSALSSADVAFSLRDSNRSLADDWSVGAEATRLEAPSTAARIEDEMCMIEKLSRDFVRDLRRREEKEHSERRRGKKRPLEIFHHNKKYARCQHKILAPGPTKSEQPVSVAFPAVILKATNIQQRLASVMRIRHAGPR